MTSAPEPRRRGLTPARIVALVVMGVLVLGMAYLRFAPGDGSVSVPAGARADDLTLKPCTYPTENGSYTADCGTLVVPENRDNPQSRLIALPVIRIRARTDHPAEPIFRLEGGPGQTNMKFKRASRFAERRDVVLVGYRGIDGSVRLDCPEVVAALRRSTDFLAEASLRAYAEGYRACADRLTRQGVALGHYGMVQQIDDLEAARVALGYDRINLVSESAGTRTAMIYSWRYPKSLHRSVMIAVNPPGNFLWDAKTADEQMGRYADLCSKDDACSGRTDNLAESIRRTVANMSERWLFLRIKTGNVRVLSYLGLFESTAATAPASAPVTLDAWLSAAEGDASGFWFTSLFADLLIPRLFVWGQYADAGSLDFQAARDYFSVGGPEVNRNLGRAATTFAWGGGRLVEAWPAAPGENEYSLVRTSEVETLLVGGELDFSTPPQVATRELLPYLPNGHEVVLAGFGHSGTFWADQPEAGSRLINAFFDSGRVDDSLFKPLIVDFTPEVTMTGLAKRVFALMVGFALLAVIALLWMARWVRRRGGFGGTASATLRSLSPIVLGLGGWFLGALIVLTALPGVPLDDAVLAVLSVGVPVGLGTYFAWVHRDWSARTKTTGLAAAAGGALVGAWLGFNVTGGLIAPVTAIVGAAVGANLILLVLDISWDQSGRLRTI